VVHNHAGAAIYTLRNRETIEMLIVGRDTTA
jgi:hypothetical protein